MLRSPFALFCLWVCVGLGLFMLKWSLLWDDLRADTLLFLLVAFAAFLLLASTVSVAGADRVAAPIRYPVCAILTAYYCVAYADNGGVPVVQILRGVPYDVYGFGINGLHVLALSLTGYVAIRLFRCYLVDRRRADLLWFLWLSCLLVSIASRSAVSFLLFACLFLFFRHGRLPARRVVLVLGVLTGFLLLFGQFGNARLSHQIRDSTGQAGRADAIVTFAQASPKFVELGLPVGLLWPYLYMASPIANLNQAFGLDSDKLCGEHCDLSGLVVYELLPDSLGNPLGRAFHMNEYDKAQFLVAPDVTASTTFGSAVGYAGIVGALLVLGVLIAVSVGVVSATRRSDISEEALAVLATLLFFSFFENMLAYSPLSLQLVWVLVRARSRSALL